MGQLIFGIPFYFCRDILDNSQFLGYHAPIYLLYFSEEHEPLEEEWFDLETQGDNKLRLLCKRQTHKRQTIANAMLVLLFLSTVVVVVVFIVVFVVVVVVVVVVVLMML